VPRRFRVFVTLYASGCCYCILSKTSLTEVSSSCWSLLRRTWWLLPGSSGLGERPTCCFAYERSAAFYGEISRNSQETDADGNRHWQRVAWGRMRTQTSKGALLHAKHARYTAAMSLARADEPDRVKLTRR
jgi:hypothetical protein